LKMQNAIGVSSAIKARSWIASVRGFRTELADNLTYS
jgi:hypothetical protein